MTTQDTDKASSRIGIIEAVQKPINFFALVVLVVEVILGITANFSLGTDRTYLIVGMLVLIFALVIIVAVFAFFRPEALSGRRPITKPQQKANNDTVLPPSVEILKKPSLLMAASQQPYATFLESDAKIIEDLYPKRQIKVHKNMTSAQLRDILTDNHYDIVHLTIPVDKDGSLIFGDGDSMPSEAFAKLVETCCTSLVVLAVCDSLTLAAKIARTTSMIAAIEYLQDKDILEWERIFYKMLTRGHPLSRAYDIARATTNAPMVLFMKKDFVLSGHGVVS